MSALEEKAVDLLDKFENLAEQYAPEVVDAAMSVVMINGIQALIFGAIALAYVAVYCWVARYIFMHKDLELFESDARAFVTVISGIGATLICLVATVGYVSELVDIWNYVAIADPKLALAHKLLGV